MVRSLIVFALGNFTLTFFVVGLAFSEAREFGRRARWRARMSRASDAESVATGVGHP
jgi:hypothetical protein